MVLVIFFLAGSTTQIFLTQGWTIAQCSGPGLGGVWVTVCADALPAVTRPPNISRNRLHFICSTPFKRLHFRSLSFHIGESTRTLNSQAEKNGNFGVIVSNAQFGGPSILFGPERCFKPVASFFRKRRTIADIRYEMPPSVRVTLMLTSTHKITASRATTRLNDTMRHGTGVIAALVTLVCISTVSSHSQEPAPQMSPAELEQRIRDLEETVRRLQQTDATKPEPQTSTCSTGEERQAPSVDRKPYLTIVWDPLFQQVAAVQKPAASDTSQKKDDGWIDTSKEGWTVRLGGHVQLDYILWPYADPAIDGATNYFSYRRLRLVADGTGYGVLDFRLQLTLEPGEGPVDPSFSPDVKDAYLSMNDIPWIGRIRIGNFFVPFSLEQVTNDTNNIFLERSIPTQGIFAADREPGLALYNCTEDENISWYAGIFFDTISDTFKTRFDRNQGYRLSGRGVWLPYYDEASEGRYLVHTGIGILHTRDFDDRVRFRARPQVQRGPILIDSEDLDAGNYTTGNLEFAIVWGQVTLQSEAFLSRVSMHTRDSLNVGGAYAHLSYFLTGENRVYERFGQHGAQFGRNRPFSNFFIVPGGTSWGAWELKARWSSLTLNSVDRGVYNDITLGFNWYWNDRTRIMFDWIHPITTKETVFGATQSDLIGMRFDFNW